MIIDGMTQKTTGLAHFERKPSWISKEEYGVHVVGTIVETLGPHLDFSYKNVGDTSDVLIDVIHSSVQRLQEHRTATGGRLPEVLFLQLEAYRLYFYSW
jgi:hypothetical protein